MYIFFYQPWLTFSLPVSQFSQQPSRHERASDLFFSFCSISVIFLVNLLLFLSYCSISASLLQISSSLFVLFLFLSSWSTSVSLWLLYFCFSFVNIFFSFCSISLSILLIYFCLSISVYTSCFSLFSPLHLSPFLFFSNFSHRLENIFAIFFSPVLLKNFHLSFLLICYICVS
jgi:hypothetical protein